MALTQLFEGSGHSTLLSHSRLSGRFNSFGWLCRTLGFLNRKGLVLMFQNSARCLLRIVAEVTKGLSGGGGQLKVEGFSRMYMYMPRVH